MSDAPNYEGLSAGDFLEALGDDAQKWAAAFCQQYPDVPEDVMIGWFANAIEHSSDVRHWRRVRSPEAWANYCDAVTAHRNTMAAIAAMPEVSASDTVQ